MTVEEAGRWGEVRATAGPGLPTHHNTLRPPTRCHGQPLTPATVSSLRPLHQVHDTTTHSCRLGHHYSLLPSAGHHYSLLPPCTPLLTLAVLDTITHSCRLGHHYSLLPSVGHHYSLLPSSGRGTKYAVTPPPPPPAENPELTNFPPFPPGIDHNTLSFTH